MSATVHDPARLGEAPAPPKLDSVACLVTDGDGGLEAVGQAATLAEGGRLTLIDAHPQDGEDRARLAVARRVAARHALEPEVRHIQAPPTAPTVQMLAAGHDLLVVAADAQDQPGIARHAVRQAPLPVMVARARRDGAAVVDRVLAAVDGSDEALAAMTLAHVIARRHGSALAAVVPAAGGQTDALMIVDLRGPPRPASEPLLIPSAHDVADAIVAAARRRDATLIVAGSRGLSGIAGLASVSSRVADSAGCSVLVVRPRAHPSSC
jgi:nucleotide-binding universal stress UspA family protein